MDPALATGGFLGSALPYLMGLGAALTIALIYAGLFVVGRERRMLLRRGESVGRRNQPATNLTQASPVLKREGNDRGGGLEAIARVLMPRPERLRFRLQQAGLDMKASSYLFTCLAVGIGTAGFMAFGVDLPPLLALLVGVAVGFGVPQTLLGFLIGQRKQKFISLFPDAIDLVVRGVRSGLPVPETLKMVGTEIGEPVGSSFRHVVEQIAVGKSLDEAMWEVATRIDVQEFRFFVIALSVQRETGGNLGETLENLSDVLRKRRQTKLKIKALSAEARMSAIIIGVLPFVLYLLINSVNPDYLTPLTGDIRGQFMLGFGLLWLVLGFGMMAKMVRFKI